MGNLWDKSESWRNGYYARGEGVMDNDCNPYSIIAQWESHEEWIDGWNARDEELGDTREAPSKGRVWTTQRQRL